MAVLYSIVEYNLRMSAQTQKFPVIFKNKIKYIIVDI